MIKSALKNSRILLVDDEDILVQGLADFLQDQGTTVDTATDGQEAIALLQEHIYDLLVTDIRMPGMSGMELLRHVQENHPSVAVILMTGYASTESAIEALRLGVYDYIEKPFEMLELLQAVVNALEHAELKRQNAKLIEEQKAHQRSLERVITSRQDEVEALQDKVQYYEKQYRNIIDQLETLHEASDAIRDQADTCRKQGRGYPGPVNRLVRTCMRECENISKYLEEFEIKFQDAVVKKPDVEQLASDVKPVYVPEPEVLNALDIETIYAHLYTYIEGFMSAQQTVKRLEVEPAFELVHHIVSSSGATDELYRWALQTPENGEDYGFSASVILHSVNVCIYALKIGVGFRYTPDQLLELGVAALLHDVGMAYLPPDFFTKGELSQKDRDLLHKHPKRAKSVLKSLGIGYNWMADVVYQEHEREDGSGYPEGLAGDDILPYAKIIGLADTYAGLTRARPERPGFLPFQAVQEITRNNRTKFAPAMLRVLISKLSTFPVGSLVRLNSGAVGQVVESNEGHPLRPTVQIVNDPQGNAVHDKRIIALREQPVLHVTDVVYQRGTAL
ncbi:MAG: response regulator [Candidatus Latescibacteria bacterium]|jgi:response regulator RpfG family c-di-GMP phosphodiesterase|nr:response regulator [Candidatus Latescibacterota bacterium]MBT4139403.1 response regulator [Candidatus Latescibacterota bacterium]